MRREQVDLRADKRRALRRHHQPEPSISCCASWLARGGGDIVHRQASRRIARADKPGRRSAAGGAVALCDDPRAAMALWPIPGGDLSVRCQIDFWRGVEIEIVRRARRLLPRRPEGPAPLRDRRLDRRYAALENGDGARKVSARRRSASHPAQGPRIRSAT